MQERLGDPDRLVAQHRRLAGAGAAKQHQARVSGERTERLLGTVPVAAEWLWEIDALQVAPHRLPDLIKRAASDLRPCPANRGFQRGDSVPIGEQGA